jgi:drug/metabolite transporter (DMT)-like permease
LAPIEQPAVEPQADNVIQGIVYAIAAFFLLSCMSAIAKILMQNHHVVEVVFARNFVALIPMLLYIGIFRRFDILKTNKPGWMLTRVIVGTTGLGITFAALAHLPIAHATVLFMMSTLIIPALSYFFLKEHIGWHRWVTIVIGFIGVILIAQPSGEVQALGVALAITAAFFHSAVHIILRKMRSESSLTITFYFILSGAFFPALLLPWFYSGMPSAHDLLLFLGLGATGGLAQYTLTKSFTAAPASVIAPFNMTGLIWASLFDVLIWNHIPGWPIFAGGGIILAAKLYIIHRERLAAKAR